MGRRRLPPLRQSARGGRLEGRGAREAGAGRQRGRAGGGARPWRAVRGMAASPAEVFGLPGEEVRPAGRPAPCGAGGGRGGGRRRAHGEPAEPGGRGSLRGGGFRPRAAVG